MATLELAKLTIISGASSNHFLCLKNLLRSLILSKVEASTIVYDLGLTQEEAQIIQSQCKDFRKFVFSRYPSYVDIEINRGEYAWKPIIVSEVMAEHDGLILWLDAGDLVFGNLEQVKRILQEYGFYSPVSSSIIKQWTHPAMLRYLDVKSELLSRRNRNGAIVGINPAYPGIKDLILRWRDFALIKECIAPEGSDRTNHRQDQALLSVLVSQFQEVYNYQLINQKIEISTHHDRLSFELLEEELHRLREVNGEMSHRC